MSAREKLSAHFNSISKMKMRDAFASDPGRSGSLSRQYDQLYVDFSRQRVTGETLDLLISLADEIHLEQHIQALFAGENINITEQRPALHMALRHSGPADRMEEYWQLADRELDHMDGFIEQLHAGEIKGSSGKPIKTLIHLGIGGSDLGPRLVIAALEHDNTTRLDIRFVANVDPQELETVLDTANPESTLFCVCSKSFSTAETLTNARSAWQWLQAHGCQEPRAHFIAITGNRQAAVEFGIAPESTFLLPAWVGGRYSIWSAIGLSVAAAVGMQQFREFLAGARSMDGHFSKEPFISNIPVLLGLIDCWNINYFKCQSLAFLPYDVSLALLPQYLSQLVMESNGKSVDCAGIPVTMETSAVIWGGTGTNAQHAFMQLLHQGTQPVPVEFLLSANSRAKNTDAHRQLVANCLAQAETLMTGTTDENLPAWKQLPGNRPNTVIIYDRLTPKILGMLLALYEHRTFVQACVWNINPFDQWGVEQGKHMADHILDSFSNGSKTPAVHSSTRALIEYLLKRQD